MYCMLCFQKMMGGIESEYEPTKDIQSSPRKTTNGEERERRGETIETGCVMEAGRRCFSLVRREDDARGQNKHADEVFKKTRLEISPGVSTYLQPCPRLQANPLFHGLMRHFIASRAPLPSAARLDPPIKTR